MSGIWSFSVGMSLATEPLFRPRRLRGLFLAQLEQHLGAGDETITSHFSWNLIIVAMFLATWHRLDDEPPVAPTFPPRHVGASSLCRQFLLIGTRLPRALQLQDYLGCGGRPRYGRRLYWGSYTDRHTAPATHSQLGLFFPIQSVDWYSTVTSISERGIF
jgi:hypothetical protein